MSFLQPYFALRECEDLCLIVGPWGEILAEGGVDPGLIQATLDLSQVKESRRRIPALEHDRQFSDPLKGLAA
jgi:deaminated glutathione amidase